MKNVIRTAIVAACVAAPTVASADIISLYVAPKADYVSGTGEVYQKFEGSMGYGALAGFELLGIDIYGEALIMGLDQYLFTANMGIDLTFGSDVRFTIGVDTGPMFFYFPDQEVNELSVPSEVRAVIGDATSNAIETEYAKFAAAEQEVSRFAVGWNIGRARAALDFQIVPTVYIGAEGHFGYHYIISGEEAAGDAKSAAIDGLRLQYPDLVGQDIDYQGRRLDAFEILEEESGAEEVDVKNLQGTNYNVGVFLKVEI